MFRVPLALVAALALFGSAASAQAPATRAPSTNTHTAVNVLSIDTGRLKGEPSELAWSADGRQLYLQTSERDKELRFRSPRSFLIALDDPKTEAVSSPPDWVTEYWNWKSAQGAPGHPGVSIEVSQSTRQVSSAGASTMGGRPGATADGLTTVNDAVGRTDHLHDDQVIALTLAGEIVGKFVNVPFVPGYSFGWAPKADAARLAYVNKDGRLAILDDLGHKRTIEATKAVLLPAWSPDGTKIAFLEKDGKNTYSLKILAIGQ